MKRSCIWLATCMTLLLVSGCTVPGIGEMSQPATPGTGQVFDLAYPPTGWHRDVVSAEGYAIWLPPDWGTYTPSGAVDHTAPTVHRPLQPGNVSVGVSAIPPVDLLDAPADSTAWHAIFEDFQPAETYTFTVAGFIIPCAQYKIDIELHQAHIHDVVHACVVPGTAQQGHHWAVIFRADQALEAQFKPVWPLILASFVLEQQAK